MRGKIFHILFGILALGLIVIAAAIGRIFVSVSKNPPLETKNIIFGGEVFQVELARSLNEKVLGLSGREGLKEGDGSANSPHGGMLFIFDEPTIQNFWMKDMLFPIDIIWINGDRIAGFAENVQPEPGKKTWELTTYSSPEPVDKVLEVRAGTVRRLGIKMGDIVSAEFSGR